MATSILMASDHTTNLNLVEDLQTRNDHHQTTARKGSSTRRKSSKANENHKKKQPQRGMGVAQLERLRLEERWKKMTEINTTISQPLPRTILDLSSFAEPKAANTVPLHFPKFGGLGNGVNGVGLNLMQQGFLVQRVGNGSSGLFDGEGLVSDDKFQGYLYGLGNMNGNSKELSSTPKVVKCYTDHSADCQKKKRTYAGENLVFNGVKDMYAHFPSIAGCDFTGLNVGSSENIKEGNSDVEKKAIFHAGTSALRICNTDQGAEVVALQKKGSSGPSGGGVLMEYEFFPGKGGCRSYESSHNELLMMKKLMGRSESSAVMGGEVSGVTTTTSTTATGGGSVDASTSIDLSLRLSY